MSFKLLVLRFMSLVLRAQWLGNFTKDEMAVLLTDIDDHIEANHLPERGRNPDGD